MQKMQDIPLHTFRYDQDGLSFHIDHIERMDATRAQAGYPNRHTFYVALWVTEGAGEHYIDFTAYTIQPNSLYFLTPGQVHFWEIDSSVSGIAILFKEEFFFLNQLKHDFLHQFDFYHRTDKEPVIYLCPERVDYFEKLFESLLYEYKSREFGRSIVISSLLQLLLVQAQREYHTNKTEHAMMTGSVLTSQYQKLITEHFLTRRTVQEYAELLCVTPGYLTETVKKVTGLPAGVLIRQRIVLSAKRLLVHTNQTISEICYQLNFNDPSYFCRFFKREAGQSPAMYRKDFRKKVPLHIQKDSQIY